MNPSDDPYAGAAEGPGTPVDPYAAAAEAPAASAPSAPPSRGADPYAAAAVSPTPQRNQITPPRGGGGGLPPPSRAAEAAIEKYYKDPQAAQLARMVIGKESSGGNSEPTPNKATALGPWQITKATADTYHLDYSRLNDLDYATKASQLILQDLLKKTGGDPLRAAVGYNAGPAWINTPFSKLPHETQDYVTKVAAGLAMLNKPTSDGTTPEQKVAVLRKNLPPPSKPMSHAEAAVERTPASAKKPAGPAEAGFPLSPQGLLHGITEVWHGFNRGTQYIGMEMDYARRHPAQAFQAVEGVLERPAGTLLSGALDFRNGLWKDPVKVIRAAGISVIRPQDHDKIINGIENGIMHDLGFSGADATKMHGFGKGLVDFFTDVGVDPFTYVGVGEVMRLLGLTVKTTANVMHAAPIAEATIKAMGNTKHGRDLLDAIAQHRENAVSMVNFTKQITDHLLAKRPELDYRLTGVKYVGKTKDLKTGKYIPGTGTPVGGTKTKLFTKYGKMSRMAVETGSNTEMSHLAQEEAAVWKHPGTTEAADTVGLFDIKKGVKAGGTFWSQLPQNVATHTLMNFAKYGVPTVRKGALEQLEKIGVKLDPHALDKYPGGLIKLPQFTSLANVIELHKGFVLTDLAIKEGRKYLPFDVIKANEFFKRPAAEIAGANMSDYMKNFNVLMRHEIRESQIARKTAEFVVDDVGPKGKAMHSLPKGHAGDVDKLATWFRNNVGSYADPVRVFGGNKFDIPWNGVTHSFTPDQWLNKLGQSFKASILGNPFAHGIINLGMTVLAHANPFVAGRALKYMWPRKLGGKGIPQPLLDSIEQGADTSYWKEHIPALSTLSNVPGIRKTIIPKGLKALYGASTRALDHMERGWRASYKQYLDKTEGVLGKDEPGWLMHELVKLQTINEHLGDYSNPTRLAAIMRAMGGLYTVFRMDVVPRAAIAAVKGKVGQNLGAAVKFGNDIGHQAGGPGGEVHINIADDMAKILLAAPTMFNPSYPGFNSTGIDYGTSIASLGPIFGSVTTGLRNRMSSIPPQTPLQAAGGLAEYLVIGGATGTQLMDPSKAEAHLPIWFRSLMHLFGGWYGKTNPKTESQRRRMFRKAGNTPLPLSKVIQDHL